MFPCFHGLSLIAQLSRDQQQHTHTDRPRYDGNNRPHLMLCMAMRPNNASKTFGGRATEDHVVSLKGQYSAPLPNILSLAC